MFLHRQFIRKHRTQTHLLSSGIVSRATDTSGGHQYSKNHSSNAIIFFVFTAIITYNLHTINLHFLSSFLFLSILISPVMPRYAMWIVDGISLGMANCIEILVPFVHLWCYTSQYLDFPRFCRRFFARTVNATKHLSSREQIKYYCMLCSQENGTKTLEIWRLLFCTVKSMVFCVVFRTFASLSANKNSWLKHKHQQTTKYTAKQK